jgi:hypothetical protein
MLGWGRINGTDFYVRQLRDMKGAVEFNPNDWDIDRFNAYCMLCGWVLALAHAKSGDAAMIAGYVGKATRPTMQWRPMPPLPPTRQNENMPRCSRPRRKAVSK